MNYAPGGYLDIETLNKLVDAPSRGMISSVTRVAQLLNRTLPRRPNSRQDRDLAENYPFRRPTRNPRHFSDASEISQASPHAPLPISLMHRLVS